MHSKLTCSAENFCTFKISCWKVEQATALFLQDCRVDQAQAQTAAVLRGLRVVVYDLVVVLVESCRQVSLSCCNTDSIGDSLTQRTYVQTLTIRAGSDSQCWLLANLY